MRYSRLTRRSFLQSASALALAPVLNACSSSQESPMPPPGIGPTTTITFFGDSLTAGTGGTPYGNFVGATLSRPIITNAIEGQRAQLIAARQGGEPITLTLNGNRFAGDSTVKLNRLPLFFLSTNANTDTITAKGNVVGVSCTITRTAHKSGTTQSDFYTIMPDIASTAEVPADSLFIVDSAVRARTTVQVLWYGRNDFYVGRADLAGASTDVMTALDYSIAYIDTPKQFLVLGVLPAQNEPDTSLMYKGIAAHNDALAVKYGSYFVGMAPPTIAEMRAINYVPTAQDNMEISKGLFPTGMRSDAIHLNNSGYQIIASRVSAKLKAQNW